MRIFESKGDPETGGLVDRQFGCREENPCPILEQDNFEPMGLFLTEPMFFDVFRFGVVGKKGEQPDKKC